MIKLSQDLQDKIYNLMMENKKLGLKTRMSDILNRYSAEFKKTRLPNSTIIRNIKTIRTWRTKPTIKRKFENMLTNDELVKQKQKELDILENEIKTLKKNQQAINSNLTMAKAKTKAYEEAMYLQKKTMNLFENIKTNVILNGEEYKIDLWESYILQLLNRAKKETENGLKPEFGKLLFDILRENEKAVLFLKKQDIIMNSNNIDELIEKLNSKEDDKTIKDVKNVKNEL